MHASRPTNADGAGRLVQRSGNGVECCLQIAAYQRQGGNDGNRNQGRNEAVLDGRRTFFGLKELADLRHSSLLFPGGPYRAPHAAANVTPREYGRGSVIQDSQFHAHCK